MECTSGLTAVTPSTLVTLVTTLPCLLLLTITETPALVLNLSISTVTWPFGVMTTAVFTVAQVEGQVSADHAVTRVQHIVTLTTPTVL